MSFTLEIKHRFKFINIMSKIVFTIYSIFFAYLLGLWQSDKEFAPSFKQTF